MPVVHVCDDACTYVSHSLQRYPVEAELAFGETRGCFEKPDDDIPPTTGLSCPEITPIEHSTRVPNREAMLNPSPLGSSPLKQIEVWILSKHFVELFD